jgi:O-antigen ligase
MNVTDRMSAAIGRPVARLTPAVVQDNTLTVVVVGIGALVLLMGSMAFFVNPIIGGAALGLPVAPLFLLYPAHTMLLLIGVMPFDNVAALLPDKTLSLTRLLGLAVIGGWAVWVLVNRVRVRLTTPGLLLGAYVGFAIMSYFWTQNPVAAAPQLQTLIQLFLLYVMSANLMTHLPTLERTANVLVMSTALLGLLVIWQLPGGGGHGGRGTFTYGDQSFNPNYLAAALVLPAVLAAALGRARGQFGWWRLAALLPIGAGILASGSRGGIVGFAAGVAFLVVARPQLGIRALGGLLVLATAAPLIMPPTMLDHLIARFSTAGSDRLSGRLDIWKVAFAMIEAHPVRGTGFAGFESTFYDYMSTSGIDPNFALLHFRGNRAAHNVYLSTLAELGIFGFGLLLAAFAAHGLRTFRAWRLHRRYGDPRVAALALGLCCTFVSVLVFGNTIDLMTRKEPWVVLGMMQGLILATEAPGQGALRR